MTWTGRRSTCVASGLMAFAIVAPGVVTAQTFTGPTPYRSEADSPFVAGITAGTTALEDFETGALSVMGVMVSGGTVVGPGGLTDSVDGDDGVCDASGTNGRSLFGSGTPGITFTFDAIVLGALPTHAGIVWTDGEGTTLFEAFGPGGSSLGTVGPSAIADGSFVGTTADDHFFGVDNAGGIESIRISNTSGGIEVDHLQFGPVTGGTPTTPSTCTAATVTPTPSATGTPTSTPTATPTSTSSSSATSTPTPQGPTSTATQTATATRTSTATPSATATPSRTATATPDPNVSSPIVPAIPALDGTTLLVLALILALVAIWRVRAG